MIAQKIHYLSKRPSESSYEDFIRVYGCIYENSPWVAEKIWHLYILKTVDTVSSLHFAMKQVVNAAGRDRQLALLRAHPDLAGRAAIAGEVSADSTKEQRGAGLDQCSPEEFDELQKLNARYREKFGFPFIIAVRGLDRSDILASFRRRIENAVEDEFNTALQEIHKIARWRLINLELE